MQYVRDLLSAGDAAAAGGAAAGAAADAAPEPGRPATLLVIDALDESINGLEASRLQAEQRRRIHRPRRVTPERV